MNQSTSSSKTRSHSDIDNSEPDSNVSPITQGGIGKIIIFKVVVLFQHCWTFHQYCMFLLDSNKIEPPQKKKTKKIPKILDGVYFTIKSNQDGKIEALCTHCKDFVKGSLSSTGNYHLHYKTKHEKMMDNLNSYLKGQPAVESKRPVLNDFFRISSDKQVN